MGGLTWFILFVIILITLAVLSRRDKNAVIVPGFGISGLCHVTACYWCPDSVYKMTIEGPAGPWRHWSTGTTYGKTPADSAWDKGDHPATPYIEYDPTALDEWKAEWFDELYDPELDGPRSVQPTSPVTVASHDPRPARRER